ncbi:MAG: hypothetical protein ACLUFN_08535 [Eubacterium sp.]
MADALDSGNATSVKVIISASAVIIKMWIKQKSKFLTESRLHLGRPHRVKFRG